MTINERVKALRKHLGLTQVEFGSRVAIAQSYLTNIERGEREVTDKIFKLICLEFSVNEEWLRNGTGEMFITLSRDEELAAWAGTVLNPESDGTFMKKFVHVLSRLSVEEWKVLEQIAVKMNEENEKAEQ